MIDHQPDLNQLPNELKSAFQELNVMKHLRQAGLRKRFGFSCARLFQLVFVLLFHQKNWFRLLESEGRIVSRQRCGVSLPQSCRLCLASLSDITQCRHGTEGQHSYVCRPGHRLHR